MSINVTVTLSPTTQTAFHDRVKSTACPDPSGAFLSMTGPQCHETVSIDMGVSDDPTSFCAVYRLSADHPECISGPVFEERVEYLIGWKAPDKGNKHDFYLLRDPDSADGSLHSG